MMADSGWLGQPSLFPYVPTYATSGVYGAPRPWNEEWAYARAADNSPPLFPWEASKQVCPVCNGTQTVSGGFYDVHNIPGYVPTTTVGPLREQCRTCNGLGVI